jgi:hypothetical protein
MSKATWQWIVSIRGTEAARKRWPTRKYKKLTTAKRRQRQISGSGDTGVSMTWIVSAKEES